jgi:hypothetical protein
MSLNGQRLNARDGFGISGIETISIQAESNAEVLLMEVPINL